MDTNKGPRIYCVPEGDDRERLTCPDCNFIAYENPKMVVGSIPIFGDRTGSDFSILLCLRDIEPRKGLWTLPAGFMEIKESLSEGAKREAKEEALVDLEMGPMISALSVAHISQVHLFFLAEMKKKEFGAGSETAEARLFKEGEIPWENLAFLSVRKSLEHFLEYRREAFIPPLVEKLLAADAMR